MSPEVRRLGPDDAAALAALRRRALDTDPLAFAASPEDDRAGALDVVRAMLADADERTVFGAFDGAALVGMIGVFRDAKRKRRHTATIWGTWVAPEARAKGLGRALLAAAIAHARGWPDVERLCLAVGATADAARRLLSPRYDATVSASR